MKEENKEKRKVKSRENNMDERKIENSPPPKKKHPLKHRQRRKLNEV